MLIRFIKKTPNLNFIDNKKFFFIISGLLSIIGKTLIAPAIPCWIEMFTVANDLTGW